MATLPTPQHTFALAIYGQHERRAAGELARSYLGASVLGEACDRRLWLAFRWAGRETFDGRMLRLFDTGHREEARLLDEMRAAGIQVWDRQPDGRQFRVEFAAGHGAGHLDAVVLGLPEAPKTPHVFDVKTVNRKKFAELLKNGFRKTYPRYWAQGQVYAGLMNLDRIAFAFVVKDDETIHLERFDFDREAFDRLMERAMRIVFAAEPPARLSNDPAWFECKFCPFHAQCHGTAAPAPTCRSCAHATPERGGTWSCECPGHPRALPLEVQRTGCERHRVIPILLSSWAQPVDVVDGAVLYRNTCTGNQFFNGPRPEGYGSQEIHACADKAAIGMPDLKAVRDEFEGEVVG